MRLFFVFLSVSLFIFTPAQAEIIKAESEITAATVYTSRATVTRRAVVQIPTGDHTVVFDGLPATLFPDSLRAEGSAAAEVQFGALTHKQVQAAELTAPRERELTTKLETLQDQRRAVEAEKQALSSKKEFLENLGKQASLRSNEEIAEINLKPEQWAGAANTIHSGISEILTAQLQLDIKLRDTDEEIRKIQRELNELRTGQRSTYEVAVPLVSDAATSLTIEISYQVPNATWQPVYDARLDTESEDLTLVQYGAVRQNTGEDWSNVSLSLSTAQPHRGASLPDLRPQWIDLWDPSAARGDAARGGNNFSSIARNMIEKPAVMSMEMADMAASPAPKEQKARFAQAEIETGGFISEYKIPGPASVTSDGSETKLMVGGFETDSKIQIHIKPQISTEAFVVALAKLKGEAPILPGQASLFRDGSYIGQTALPLLRPGEEHDLFFGIDDQLSVKRHVVKDQKDEAGIVARSNALERHFVTELQNLHSQPVEIVVRETIPVPRNDKIEVQILKDVTTPDYTSDVDNIKGLLGWTFTLPAKEERELGLGWRVSWPKDQNLSGL